MTRCYCQAIEARGYGVICAIGYGQRPDGTYSVKVAANPNVRHLDPETWQVLHEHIVRALEQIYETPMDDLEWEQ